MVDLIRLKTLRDFEYTGKRTVGVFNGDRDNLRKSKRRFIVGSKLNIDRILSRSIYGEMKAITYTAARENLAATMDQVCNDRDPVIITRNRDQAVVMMSLNDFESLEETAYLLRSRTNAKRLLEAIDSLESGRGKARKLVNASPK